MIKSFHSGHSILQLKNAIFQLINYSGNRLRSKPLDQEKVLTLSEVDLIHIQGHSIVKYS